MIHTKPSAIACSPIAIATLFGRLCARTHGPNERGAPLATYPAEAHVIIIRTETRVPGVRARQITERRVKLKGVLPDLVPGRRIVWQLKLIIRQPVRLILELEENGGGVCVTHTIRAGFEGIGRLLDPLFRLWFTQEFTRAMDEHVKTEFPMLGRMLQTT